MLFIAACGTSAPSQSVSSIPGASSPSQLAQAPVVMNESPVAAITPSLDHSTTDNPSGIRDLDVHSASIEATLKSVVLTPTLDPPSATPTIPTPTLAVIQLDRPPLTVVSDPTALVDQPAPALQDIEAKLGENPSLSEVTPIPTTFPAPIEASLPPSDVPISVAVEEVIDPEETSAADGGAHRFVSPSASGGEVSLDEYLERGNVVLVFYRAFW